MGWLTERVKVQQQRYALQQQLTKEAYDRYLWSVCLRLRSGTRGTLQCINVQPGMPSLMGFYHLRFRAPKFRYKINLQY